MAQGTQEVTINGTPQGVVAIADQLGSMIGLPFSYAKALQLDNVAGSGGVIGFVFLALAFILLIEILVWAAPLLRTILDLVLKVIAAIKPF
jgi:hypothetical protein